MVKHLHHIIPKHMGGTDDPSNLVELTVEEHAEAHKKLWEEYGNWQDKLAWMGLSKMIDKQKLIKELQSNATKQYHQRPEVKEKYAKLNEERWKNKDHIAHVSNFTKKQWENPDFVAKHRDVMTDFNKKVWNDPSFSHIKEKMISSNRNNNRKVMSLNDGKITSWSSRTKHEKKTGYKHEWREM